MHKAVMDAPLTQQDTVTNENVKVSQAKPDMVEGLLSRSDLHLGRRAFHMGNGIILGCLYAMLFTDVQMVYFFGTVATLVYVTEQFRLAYPKMVHKFRKVTRFLMRTEEQIKESAMIPYSMGVLLILLTFPKSVALVAIFTLAVADPMAAIVGIRFGKHKLSTGKSVEGSLAFFTVTFVVAFLTLGLSWPEHVAPVLAVALVGATLVTIFEAKPIKVDDNLTIPIFTAVIFWLLCMIFGVPF